MSFYNTSWLDELGTSINWPATQRRWSCHHIRDQPSNTATLARKVYSSLSAKQGKAIGHGAVIDHRDEELVHLAPNRSSSNPIRTLDIAHTWPHAIEAQGIHAYKLLAVISEFKHKRS